MNLYTTKIKAIDPRNGKMKQWSGPNVPGISFEDAEAFCQENGLGYCEIVGQLVAEIPELREGGPDWEKRVDHDLPGMN